MNSIIHRSSPSQSLAKKSSSPDSAFLPANSVQNPLTPKMSIWKVYKKCRRKWRNYCGRHCVWLKHSMIIKLAWFLMKKLKRGWELWMIHCFRRNIINSKLNYLLSTGFPKHKEYNSLKIQLTGSATRKLLREKPKATKHFVCKGQLTSKFQHPK